MDDPNLNKPHNKPLSIFRPPPFLTTLLAVGALTLITVAAYAFFGGAIKTVEAHSPTPTPTPAPTLIAVDVTSDVSIGNLDKPGDKTPCVVNNYRKCAIGFRSGKHDDGYTLTHVTAMLDDASGDPGEIIATFHAVADNTGTGDGRRPADTPLATLTLEGDGQPTTAGNYVFTCFGLGCNMTARTMYFVQLASTKGYAGSSDNFTWLTTSSHLENLIPDRNGFWIWNEQDLYNPDDGWTRTRGVPRLKVSANLGQTKVLFFDGEVADQSYTRNTTIHALSLPTASANIGDPAITYTLTPALPAGLTFSEKALEIAGTPTEVVTHAEYTYTASADDYLSATVSFHLDVVVPITVPGAPTNLTAAVNQTNKTVTLSWTAPADDGNAVILGYAIERTGQSSATYELVDPDTTFTTPALADGSYTFTVKAKNTAGTGSASAPATVTVETPASTPTPSNNTPSGNSPGNSPGQTDPSSNDFSSHTHPGLEELGVTTPGCTHSTRVFHSHEWNGAPGGQHWHCSE